MEKQRMTLVLNTEPDDCTAQDIALAAVEVAGGISLLHWAVQSTVPEDMDVGARDQLSATLRDTGPGACVMVVWVGL